MGTVFPRARWGAGRAWDAHCNAGMSSVQQGCSIESADALEQLARFNLERTGELHDIFNPEVAFAAFDPADVGRVKPGFFGKFFLRPLSFLVVIRGLVFQKQRECDG